jgi:hypothetical protein
VKPRHAAALALVGWYLMLPTPYGSTDLKHVPKLPLSKWMIEMAFDDATTCETALTHAQHQYRKEAEGKPLVEEAEGKPLESKEFKKFELYGAGQCVASDDPRLKEK